MAEIQPITAWRYNKNLTKNIDQLVSPLFDVVSLRQRETLYKNPLNSIHLSVPQGDPPEKKAAETLKNWVDNDIIQKDEKPGIYVYYQHFRLPGSDQYYCRKGFIADIKIYDWDENVLLRHENTMPGSVQDRIAILDSTHLNVSPTHGLYEDPSFELEKYMDISMETPLYETEDYQGVKDVLSVITDAAIIQKFINQIKEKQIILADGHHRYAGSLAYKKLRKKDDPNHSGKEGYNYHMMYLTNMEADDIRILPTHRLIKNYPNPDKEGILSDLAKYFEVTKVDNNYEINEVIVGKNHTFGFVIGDEAFKICLKPGLENKISWNFPDKINQLDLTIVHYYIIEKIIGIPGKNQRKSNQIDFDRNFTDCLLKVSSNKAQMAIIVNEVTMKEIKDVCFSGFTLPQKSTYFYPKVISGFLFHSIDDIH